MFQLNEYETDPYFLLLIKPKLDIGLFVDFCAFTWFKDLRLASIFDLPAVDLQPTLTSDRGEIRIY